MRDQRDDDDYEPPPQVMRKRRNGVYRADHGFSGPTRRYVLMVALLVGLASIPTLAIVTAGSNELAGGKSDTIDIPFLPPASPGPVLVSPPVGAGVSPSFDVSPAPGASVPGSPAPGLPTVGSPAPGFPVPGSSTPGFPAPDSPAPPSSAFSPGRPGRPDGDVGKRKDLPGHPRQSPGPYAGGPAPSPGAGGPRHAATEPPVAASPTDHAAPGSSGSSSSPARSDSSGSSGPGAEPQAQPHGRSAESPGQDQGQSGRTPVHPPTSPNPTTGSGSKPGAGSGSKPGADSGSNAGTGSGSKPGRHRKPEPADDDLVRDLLKDGDFPSIRGFPSGLRVPDDADETEDHDDETTADRPQDPGDHDPEDHDRTEHRRRSAVSELPPNTRARGYLNGTYNSRRVDSYDDENGYQGSHRASGRHHRDEHTAAELRGSRVGKHHAEQYEDYAPR